MSLVDDSFNARELAAGRVRPAHVTALVAAWQEANGLQPDGRLGPATLASIDREIADTPLSLPFHGIPPDQGDQWAGGFDGPLLAVPTTRQGVYETFGDPGTEAKPNKAWAKANIIEVQNLPGVPTKWHVQVHRLVEPYLREGLRRGLTSYRIERLGCWNIRHVQNDSAKPLSLHSWGIAVDINSDQNAARTLEGDEKCEPWSTTWMKLWPMGVTRPFVMAMESAGFTWGGVWGARLGDFSARAKAISFFDPMHFELRGR